MADLHGNRVVLVLRDNPEGTLPRFLGAAKYVDLRGDPYGELPYFELLHDLHDLHGLEPTPRPPLGRNPFLVLPAEGAADGLRYDTARYSHPELVGVVTFDCTNNNGLYAPVPSPDFGDGDGA